MIDHFGLLAPLYDRLIGHPDPGRLGELLDLPSQGVLLEAGGGTGRVSAQLRRLVGNLVVSDLSLPMLRQARAKDCAAVASYVEALPFPGGAFDRVLVVDAFHHFLDQRRAVAELVRVLRPGGRLVIEEPDLNRLVVKFIALAEKAALMRSHFFYPNEIGRMVAAYGLRPRIESDGQNTVWVIAEKPPSPAVASPEEGR